MWKKNDDMSILKKLSIVDRGHDSSSEEEVKDNMVTCSEGETGVEQLNTDDESALFDRDALLTGNGGRSRASSTSSVYGGGAGNRNRMAHSSSAVPIFRGLLVCCVFFSIGLCLSIVGPTLPDLQSRTNTSSLTHVIGLISANAFGSLIGLAFAGSVLSWCVSALCILASVLLLCAGLTFLIPWCSSLTLLTLICFAQGICIGFLERAGYSLFYSYWRKRHKVLQLFYLVLSLGAVITPLITTPFVFDKVPLGAQSTHIQESTVKPLFKRDANVNVTTLNPNQYLNNAVDNWTLSMEDMFTDGNVTTGILAVDAVNAKPDVAVNTETETKADKIQEHKAEAVEKQVMHDKIKANVTIEGKLGEATTMTSFTKETTVASTSTSTTTPKPTTTTTILTTTTTKKSAEMLFEKTTSAPLVTSSVNSSVRDSLMQLGWDVVLSRVREFNRVRFAYLVISVLSTASTLLFSLMCCCVPCRSALNMPSKSPSDTSLSPKAVCANPNNLQALSLAMVYSFLTSSIESTIYNLLTIYVLSQGQSQLSGVILTSTYWGCVSLSRILFIVTSTKIISTTSILTWGVSTTLLSTAILSVLADYSYAFVYIGTIGVGIGVAPLMPVGYSWLDTQLNWSPWVSTLWLAAAHLGRLIVPALTGAIIVIRNSPKILMLSLLVCSLCLLITYLFLTRVCREASQLIAVSEFTRQIRHSNNHVAKYNRMPDDIVDIDDDFDDNEGVVHFDRVRDVNSDTANGLTDGGLFDLYLRK